MDYYNHNHTASHWPLCGTLNMTHQHCCSVTRRRCPLINCDALSDNSQDRFTFWCLKSRIIHKWLFLYCTLDRFNGTCKGTSGVFTLQVWTPGMKSFSWTGRTRVAWTSPTWRQRSPSPRWLWPSALCRRWTAGSSATCRHAARTQRTTSTRISSPRAKARRTLTTC